MAAALRHQASINSSTSGTAHSPTSSASSQNTTPTTPHFLHAGSATSRQAGTHPYGAFPQEARSTTSLSITHPRPPTPPLLRAPAQIPFPAYLRSWGPPEIATFLGLYRCGQYAAVFQKNDIDGKVLLDLDMATLKEMGIAKVGERVKLLGGIKDLRRRAAGVSREPVPVPRIELRLNGASTPISGRSQSPDLRRQASTSSPAGSSSQNRRLNSGRPPPLDLHPHQPSRPLPMAYQNHPASATTHSQHQSLTTPRPRLQQSSSSNATVTIANSVPAAARSNSLLRAPPSRDGSRRSPSPINADSSSFVDRPLPAAPGAGQQQSSAAEYANSITQRRQAMEGRSTPVDQRPTPSRPAQVNAATKNEHRKQTSIGATPPRKETSPIKSKFAQFVGARPNQSNSPVHPFAAGSSPYRSADPREDSAGSVSIPAPTPAAAGATSSLNAHRRQLTGGVVPGTSGMAPSKSSSSDHKTTEYAISKEVPTLSQAQSLEDIRKQVVKFIMAEDDTSRTVNVASCTSGVEVLERVLKKFGKWNEVTASISTDDEFDEDDDYLQVDGWGLYTDRYPNADSTPLSEANILGICLSQQEEAIREQGLILRRKPKQQFRKNMDNYLGDPPPSPLSPASPGFNVGPRYGLQAPVADEELAVPSPRSKSAAKINKNAHRASTVSILSGLGVPMPDVPPSPSPSRSPSTTSFLGLKKKPLYNFFGHRPPSELIANHLGEYFPAAKPRQLEKSRNSMLRMSVVGPKRMSYAPSEKRGSFETDRTDRKSITTPPRRKSVRPVSRTIASPPPAAIPEEGEPEIIETLPRMSVSNDGGQVSRPRIDGEPDTDGSPLSTSKPPFLPPFEPSKETLADTLGAFSPLSKPRPKSISQARRGSVGSNKSRMSTISQLRRNRDRSDTASMLTVDEITAEVEHRRASMITFDESSDEDAVAVPPMADPGLVPQSQSEAGSDADEEDMSSDEEETESEAEEDEDSDESVDSGHGKAFTSTGSVISKWIKGALIGAGSFGSVYLGMDAQSGMLMAVKQVELPTGPAEKNEDRKKGMVDALEREIELLKTLQHENIVQYLDSSADGTYLNIFLEYVPGGSVAALLSNYGAFEEPLVRNFSRQILTGLNYLHEREIIHRDIKGANILVDNKGGIKISDFGISKKVEDSLLTSSKAYRVSLQGSIFWMAPESVKQTNYSSKSDIWSVGCLVVEMLTGSHPWSDLSQMQAIFRIGAFQRPNNPTDIAPETDDFLNRTFEIKTHARPSAAELLQHPFISPKKGGSGGTMISAQQAKHAMAAAVKARDQTMTGVPGVNVMAEAA